MTDETQERHPGLSAIMAEVNTTMGAGIMTRGVLPMRPVIPTGIIDLDMSLFGGVPEGQISQFYGWEGSGKTTMAMRVAGNAIRKYPNRAVVFVDFERTFDPDWAHSNGVDNPDDLYVVEPETAEQGVDLIDALYQENETAVLIVDSLPAMMPQMVMEKSAEDPTVAIRARLVGLMVGKLQALKTGHRNKEYPAPTVIVINQWRNKIGVLHGDPRTLPGGNQLRFALSCSVELKSKEIPGTSYQSGVACVTHNQQSYKIAKFKGGAGAREGTFDLIRDDTDPRGTGFLEDGTGLLRFMKAYKYHIGGGRNQGIVSLFDGCPNQNAVLDRLRNTPEESSWLRAQLIMSARMSQGMTPVPSDSYLAGRWITDDEITFARAKAEEDWGITVAS